MPRITVQHRGSFKKVETFLDRMAKGDLYKALDRYAKEGVVALQANTPQDSGETAASWDYSINRSGRSLTITWTNTNVVNGVPIAIILQYGHGTGTGGYVQGQDYINPAMKPVFDRIADNVWRVVTTA